MENEEHQSAVNIEDNRVSISKKVVVLWLLVSIALLTALGVVGVSRMRAGSDATGTPDQNTRSSGSGDPRGSQVQNVSPAEWAKLRGQTENPYAKEFHSASTSSGRKQEILQHLIASSAEPALVLPMIDSLPEGERSNLWAQYAEHCVVTSPDDYFQILEKLAPGSNRSSALTAGVAYLNGPNLGKLLAVVASSGDRDEVDDVSERIRNLGPDHANATSHELQSVMQNVSNPDLRSALAFAAGRLVGESGRGDLSADDLRAAYGENVAEQYQVGKYTQAMRNDPDAFLRALSGNELSEKSKPDLIRAFASSNESQKTLPEALAAGSRMSPNNADIYNRSLGVILAVRDTLAASKAISGLPDGRQKDVMAAELVNYLRSKGDNEGAAQWEAVVSDKSLIRKSPTRR